MRKTLRILATILLSSILFSACSNPYIDDIDPISYAKYPTKVNRVIESDIKLGNSKRISNEFIESFVPNSNDGAIYPFMGNGNYTYEVEINCGTDSITHVELYGLCDSTGTIVCDPIYTDIYFNNKSYLTYRLDEAGNRRAGIVSIDGLRIAEYSNDYCHHEGNNTIFYDSENKKFDVYDDAANLIFSTDTLDKVIPKSNYGGTTTLCNNSYYLETVNYVVNIKTNQKFKKKSGYEVISGNNGDVILKSKYNDKMLIYSDSELIISGKYIKRDNSFNDTYLLRKDESTVDIFDKFGNYKATIDCKDSYTVGNRIFAFNAEKNPTTMWIYDTEGKLLDTKDVTNMKAANCLFWDDYNDKYMYVNDLYEYKDLVVDYDMNVIYECKKDNYVVFDEKDEMYICNYEKNEIYKVSTNETFNIGEVIGDEGYIEYIVDNKAVIYRKADGAGQTLLVDFDGNIIFSNDFNTTIWE